MILLGAVPLDVFVGVKIAFQLQNANRHSLIEQDLYRSFGGIRARGIGVEVHHDVFCMALDGLHLVGGESRAATGHHVLYSSYIDADHVHVTFHQNRRFALAHDLLGAMKIVKYLALLVDLGLR